VIPQLLPYFSCRLNKHDCTLHRRVSLISCRPYDGEMDVNARERDRIARKEDGSCRFEYNWRPDQWGPWHGCLPLALLDFHRSACCYLNANRTYELKAFLRTTPSLTPAQAKLIISFYTFSHHIEPSLVVFSYDPIPYSRRPQKQRIQHGPKERERGEDYRRPRQTIRALKLMSLA
jgi:hypothetical protein